MAYSLTIGGIEREVLIDSLSITAPQQWLGTMTGEFISVDGSLVIDLEEEIILTLDGTRLFRGTVAQCRLRGAAGPGGDGNDSIVWEVSANDSSWPLDYHVTSDTIPAGSTIKEAIEILMPSVPELTLDASQVDGPTITEEIVFSNTKLREAFNRIISEAIAADTHGWFLRITHLEVLEAIAPGDALAPFDLVEGDGTECGDVETEDRRDDNYATRVIVQGGIVQHTNRAESFTGDGVNDTFTLDFTPTHVYGYVTYQGIYETLSIAPAGGATWVFDPAANTIQRVSGTPANASTIVVTFDGFKQIIGDTGETSPPGRTVVEQIDGLLSTDEANAAAARILAELSASQKTISYPTRRHGLQVGDRQSVTSAKRKIPSPTDYYVTELRLTFDGATAGDGLLYRVNAAVSPVVSRDFRGVYKQWARVGAGGAVAPQGVAHGCGWDYYDHAVGIAAKEGTAGAVFARDEGGGPNYGIINKPAVLAVMNKNAVNTVCLALGNTQRPLSEFLTFRQITGGGFDIEANDAATNNLVNYAGGWNLQGLGLSTSPGAPSSSGQRLDQFGLNFLYGTAVAVNRVTATTHAISSSDSMNNIRTMYLYDTTAACAATLPALADAAVTGGAVNRARVLLLKNASTLYTVTFDANSSETIDGRLTKVLMPGASVVLAAYGGTGSGWYTVASHKPPLVTPITDAQIKSWPTTPIAVGPAPGTGWRVHPIAAWCEIDTTAGDYTNIHANASMVMTVAGTEFFSYLVNGNATGLTQVSDLFTASTQAVWRMHPYALGGGAYGTAFTGDWGLAAGLVDAQAQENAAVQLSFDNAGAGALTGGNGANTGRIVISDYELEPVL